MYLNTQKHDLEYVKHMYVEKVKGVCICVHKKQLPTSFHLKEACSHLMEACVYHRVVTENEWEYNEL